VTEPVAFLCHASEDKLTLSVLADELMRRGVNVFFDEWEIGPGDSIRQKIDSGLKACTHFIAVLSEASLRKPWVNQELDAGLMLKLEGVTKLIPLRLGLPVTSLPPLLRGMHSPAIGDPIETARDLASFMHGISKKPPLGEPPQAVRRAHPQIGISPTAQAIARVMVERSKYGRPRDPQFTPEQLSALCDLSEDDIVTGIDELKKMEVVEIQQPIGHRRSSIAFPDGRFFLKFDPIFGNNDPEADARLVAAHLVNTQSGSGSAHDLAAQLGWEPRRLNPALEYLAMKNLIKSSNELDLVFSHAYFMTTAGIKSFVLESR